MTRVGAPGLCGPAGDGDALKTEQVAGLEVAQGCVRVLVEAVQKVHADADGVVGEAANVAGPEAVIEECWIIAMRHGRMLIRGTDVPPDDMPESQISVTLRNAHGIRTVSTRPYLRISGGQKGRTPAVIPAGPQAVISGGITRQPLERHAADPRPFA